MARPARFLAAIATAVMSARHALAGADCAPARPSIKVPAAPASATLTYKTSVPDGGAFPETQVALSYSDEHLHIVFTARDEVDFFFNASHGTNDDIWQYEVMEAFIHRGTDDPQQYLEFEVSPNNVTYQAFVYNPSKTRAAGAPFDHMFVGDATGDGFGAATRLDRAAGVWESRVVIPLGLFNVDRGAAAGTKWRMNFFRTVVGPSTFPNQTLGAWSPPAEANFHVTSYLGDVEFV